MKVFKLLPKGCLLFFALLSPTQIFGQLSDQSTSFLRVRGSAVLLKPADELEMNIGVLTQDRTAELALSGNSQQMEQVIYNLKAAGLADNEHRTGRFMIQPIFSQRPKTATPDWKPQIIGFEVSNSVEIKTDKIDLAGVLIDTAAKGGANQIDQIRFQLRDPRKYRLEAIEAATRNAIEDAKTLGNAAKVHLKRITNIALDDVQAIAPLPRAQFFAKTMGAESVPIEGGDVEVQASVTVQFEID